MPHRLLISLKMIKPSKYREYLSEYETISGETTDFYIEVKNKGDNPTPTGKIHIRIEKVAGITEFGLSVVPVEMKSLKPNEAFAIRGKENLMDPGLWFMRVKAEFDDKEKIEYLHPERKEASKMAPSYERWAIPLYVVDKRILELNILIEKLLRKGEK